MEKSTYDEIFYTLPPTKLQLQQVANNLDVNLKVLNDLYILLQQYLEVKNAATLFKNLTQDIYYRELDSHEALLLLEYLWSTATPNFFKKVTTFPLQQNELYVIKDTMDVVLELEKKVKRQLGEQRQNI